MLVWRKGNIEKKLSLCYSIVYYYNGAQRYEHAVVTGQSTVSAFDRDWFSSLSSKRSCVLYLHGAIHMFKKILLTPFSLPFTLFRNFYFCLCLLRLFLWNEDFSCYAWISAVIMMTVMTVNIRDFEFSFHERRNYRLNTHAMGHFTFWISPSLSGIQRDGIKIEQRLQDYFRAFW